MKKRARIIQISGLRGILMMLFIASCLAAGFIAFPAFVAMHLWNWLAAAVAIPAINIYQGLLLWAIIAISGFILNDRKKFLVSFKTPDKLTDQEVKSILERVKMQSQGQALNYLYFPPQVEARCSLPVFPIRRPMGGCPLLSHCALSV